MVTQIAAQAAVAGHQLPQNPAATWRVGLVRAQALPRRFWKTSFFLLGHCVFKESQ